MNRFFGRETEVKKYSMLHVRLVYECAHKLKDVMAQFYQGAFLPFDRGDRIVLAELVDSVADATQSSACAISFGRIDFPLQFKIYRA